MEKAKRQIVNKTCKRCKIVQPISNYHKSTKTLVGSASVCKKCMNSILLGQLSWDLLRAGVTEQLTEEDLQPMIKFYNDCPDGYSVDHIIPLGGDPYRGLQRLENLQYLRSDINAVKSSGYDIAWTNSCPYPACKLDRASWVSGMSISSTLRMHKALRVSKEDPEHQLEVLIQPEVAKNWKILTNLWLTVEELEDIKQQLSENDWTSVRKRG